MPDRPNPFTNYYESYDIKKRTKNPRIHAGEYSYYAGYYHGKDFDDCVWYMNGDENIKEELIIGKFCSIATGVTFMMGGNCGHRYDWIAQYPLDGFDPDFVSYRESPLKAYKSKGNTVIGNDVWIGAEAMIMPGITIGDGAMIAARAMVTKNVEPYAIVGGNPAQLIKKRFSDESIALLLKTEWWNWPLDKIRQHIALLQSADVTGLQSL